MSNLFFQELVGEVIRLTDLNVKSKCIVVGTGDLDDDLKGIVWHHWIEPEEFFLFLSPFHWVTVGCVKTESRSIFNAHLLGLVLSRGKVGTLSIQVDKDFDLAPVIQQDQK